MTVNKDLKIEIRRVPNFDEINKFAKNLEGFAQPKTYSPLVNPETHKYATGLSEEDVKYLKENGFPYDLSDDWKMGVVHPFWESQVVKISLGNTTEILHPGKSLMDFVKWKFLKIHKYVYASEQEMSTGIKTQATHYIYDEGIEIEMKATKIQKRNKLIKDIGKLSLARKRDIILIIENENTDNKDENYLEVKFDDILNDKAKTDELIRLLEQDKDTVSMAALIKSCIHKNILKRTKQGIFYFENNLGFSEADVIEFLSQDENQELLLSIKEKNK